MIMKRLFYKISILVVLIASNISLYAQNENNFKIGKNLDIFAHLLNELNINYVDTLNVDDLVRTSIDEMLKKLDPYTFYISEDEVDDFEVFTTGIYGGIGVDILSYNGKVIASGVHEGFSGQRAGIKTGDIFIEVDGQNVEGKSSAEVSKLVKGKPGSKLTLKFKRLNVKENVLINLTRETIKIDNVPYYSILDKNIGYIYLSSFTTNAAKEVKNAFLELKNTTELKGLILDLRGNGGGLLSEAVEIVNLFVEKGKEVVSTKGKITDKNFTHRASSTPIDLEIPLVVLINSNSASASEIVAGAIQDLDRGILIGQRSFGKGLVQNVVPLNYNSQVKITVAKYYIPSGRCIQAIDYSLKDENGNFTTIPDSLISEFKTSKGRKVFDGGGIEPDIKIEPRILSKIAISLFSKLLIFDYAVKYNSEHKNIPSIKDFELTENDYQDFIAYIQDKDYDYETQSEQSLKKLIENAKKESYYEAIKDQLEALEKSMIHNKETDLEKHKGEIIRLLEMEIAAKYYYEKGRIQVSLKKNNELEKAIETLKSVNQYQAILKPVEK